MKGATSYCSCSVGIFSGIHTVPWIYQDCNMLCLQPGATQTSTSSTSSTTTTTPTTTYPGLLHNCRKKWLSKHLTTVLLQSGSFVIEGVVCSTFFWANLLVHFIGGSWESMLPTSTGNYSWNTKTSFRIHLGVNSQVREVKSRTFNLLCMNFPRFWRGTVHEILDDKWLIPLRIPRQKPRGKSENRPPIQLVFGRRIQLPWKPTWKCKNWWVFRCFSFSKVVFSVHFSFWGMYMVCPWLWMAVVWGVLGKLFRCAVFWTGALQCWEMTKDMLLGIELTATMPNYLSIQLLPTSCHWLSGHAQRSTSYISKPTNPKAESYTPQANFYLKTYYGGPPRLKLRRTTWVWHFVPGFPTTSTTCQNTRVKQGPTRKTLMWFIGR